MAADRSIPEGLLSDHDARLAADSARVLARAADQDGVRLVVPGAGVVELPRAALELLIGLLGEMAKGNAVTLIPVHAELTTQQAAELLGVSRPFVVKEIESGRLPARKVGSHRRVQFKDLTDYRARMRADSDRAMNELAEMDERLGLE